MMKLSKKLISTLSAFVLAAVLLIPGNANAALIYPYETDNASNPNIIRAGDWAWTTLTPGDVDYYRFTNTYGYQRAYTIIVDSPDGYDYAPVSIGGSGIIGVYPVAQQPGYHQFDILTNPGAVVNIEVASFGGYSPDDYFIVLQ